MTKADLLRFLEPFTDEAEIVIQAKRSPDHCYAVAGSGYAQLKENRKGVIVLHPDKQQPQRRLVR